MPTYTYFKLESIQRKTQYALTLPETFSAEWFALALDLVWRANSSVTPWLELEAFQRDVCKANLNDTEKVTLIRESLGAFTGRGVA